MRQRPHPRAGHTNVPPTPRDDIIAPPLAMRPEELCRLIADAVGDGDLDAALTYYEPDAVTALDAGAPQTGLDAIRQTLVYAVDAKSAYGVELRTILITGEIALLGGRWSMHGSGPDGTPTAVSGTMWSVARLGSDGAWRVAAENLTRDIVVDRLPAD